MLIFFGFRTLTGHILPLCRRNDHSIIFWVPISDDEEEDGSYFEKEEEDDLCLMANEQED